MDARRLVIRDLDGHIVKHIDISDLDHANTQAPIFVDIETRCDVGDWHRGQRVELVPWGRRITRPDY